MIITKKEILKELESMKFQSAWEKGVKEYAIDLVSQLEMDVLYSNDVLCIQGLLMKGASNALDYSYNGFAFIYDEDIAKRLCTPSELKRTKNGELMPNNKENWLFVQARAIAQAIGLVKSAISIISVSTKK